MYRKKYIVHTGPGTIHSFRHLQEALEYIPVDKGTTANGNREVLLQLRNTHPNPPAVKVILGVRDMP